MQTNEFQPLIPAADSLLPMKPRGRNTPRVTHADDERVPRRTRRTPAASAEVQKLTPREYEVLVHLSKGLRYKEIVDRLGISQGTLHFFIRNLYAKLCVHSRSEAVMKLLKG